MLVLMASEIIASNIYKTFDDFFSYGALYKSLVY